jgi:hypothetical protein
VSAAARLVATTLTFLATPWGRTHTVVTLENSARVGKGQCWAAAEAIGVM